MTIGTTPARRVAFAGEHTIAASEREQKRSILVVDDDEGIRENIADLLQDEYHVLAAKDADEAMRFLEREPVDLLLTDFQMPGPSGVELIEAARRKHAKLPAVLMTAYIYVYEQLSDERRKDIAFLRKPFDADEVLRVIAAGLRKNNGGSG